MTASLKLHLVVELGHTLFDRFFETDQRHQHALTLFAASGRLPLFAFSQAAYKRFNGYCSNNRIQSNVTSSSCASLSLHFLGSLSTDSTIFQLPLNLQQALLSNKFIVDVTLWGRFRFITEVFRVLYHCPNLQYLSCDLSVFLRLIKESDLELPHLRCLKLQGQRKPFNFRLTNSPRIPFPKKLVFQCFYKSKSAIGELFSPITQFPGVEHLEININQYGFFTADDFLAVDSLIAMFPDLKCVIINVVIVLAILDNVKDVIPLLNVLTTKSPRKNVKFTFRYWGRAQAVSQNYREIFEDRGFSIERPGIFFSANCIRNQNFSLHMVFWIPSL